MKNSKGILESQIFVVRQNSTPSAHGKPRQRPRQKRAITMPIEEYYASQNKQSKTPCKPGKRAAYSIMQIS